jgi:hypothetical protein
MDLLALLRQGCGVRHCEWPPYHYAELGRTEDGREALHHVGPFGSMEVISLPLATLREADGWLLAGWSRNGIDLRTQF